MTGVKASSGSLVETPTSRYGFYEDYPDFHRSPRIIYREPEEKITIKGPIEMPRKPANQLLRAIVPPLVMVGMVVLISYFQPRGIYMYIMVVTSIVTVIFSITNFFRTRKEYREAIVEREVLFRDYLLMKAKELYGVQEEQKHGQLYHYPEVSELLEMAQSYHHRIYEKTPLHFDFLTFRLGLGEREASFKLNYPPLDKEKKLDDLEKEGEALYDQYRKTHELPIVTSLMQGPVGIIGPRPVVLEQLQLLIHQLAFFHSYHDLQVITLAPEEEKDQWHWLRWLPHATLQDINVRGLVYNQRSRDQVLNSLYQVLKIRKAQRANKEVRESTIFTPHYVVVVTDASFILDHVIMEFFTEDPTSLGCSVIFVQDAIAALSENITTIIDIKDRNYGILVLEKGELVSKTFALDHFPADFDKERLPRLLAPLNHLQNLKNSIPETVGFLELYGVRAVSELNIPQLWAAHAPHQSLAVPLGLRGKADKVYLDLHEKAHGPHGLVAGTTGAGKSEIIQSYILSLAINFHPHDVAFLLIDYKGGGMANLFKDLPHLLGAITNLDAAASMRALASINAELKRRQRLFSRYEVNHINQYQKLYKSGEADEPMPHLFLISDEFAELKSNEPEFMKELVSTSRIGRSLGIHLILATQKPTGVVDDQIWSNSRFKLALKVATTQDSQEMLKTPDAADITQSGRAYLQVGHNEIYELFQSAYSGADYQPDKDALNIEDHTIYSINANGQYDILTQDLSGLDAAEQITQIPTELEVIVDAIRAETDKAQIPALPRPWLPPLAERIFVQDLRPTAFHDGWKNEGADLTATLGMVDLPSQQAQHHYQHDFTEDGSLVLFSQPTMGKSTFLQTVIMDLARHNRPDRVQFYLFDFGTNGILPLSQLPHVADLMGTDSTEKLSKWMAKMRAELERRKKLFSRYTVSNLDMYHQVSDDRLPYLFIVIDSYDGVKDTKVSDDLEQLYQIIARDGESLGIFLIITASRITALKNPLYINIKRRLAFKLTEATEATLIVGRSKLIQEDIPGRGLISLHNEPQILQTALPVKGTDTYALNQALQAEVKAMDQAWTGQRPKAIPIVPSELSFSAFSQALSVQEAAAQQQLPLGLDFTEVESVQVPLKTFKHLLYVSDNPEHLSNISHHLIQTLSRLTTGYRVMLIDTDGEFERYGDQVFAHVSNPATVADMGSKLYSLLEARKAGREESTPFFIVIPDIEQLVLNSDLTVQQLTTLYRDGYQYGLMFIIGGQHQYFYNGALGSLPRLVRTDSQYHLFGMRLTDQNLVDKTYNNKEAFLEPDELYLYNRKNSTKLKISLNIKELD